MYSSQTRLLLKIIRQGLFRLIARLIEGITIPRIMVHYCLRKKCITGLVRSALITGTKQIVIVGAGIDSLSFELHREFQNVRFWEIDHPATQRHKLRAFPAIGVEGLHFVTADLNAGGLDNEELIKSGFDPIQRTCWIAEGLLMYLPEHVVSSLMRTLKSLSAPDSHFAFTFMEKRSNGEIRFDSQSQLVDWWLRRHGEPFVWGTTQTELVELVRPWRVTRFFDHVDLREMAPGLAGERIARGEAICLAEI
jgi:methyltransferase (TIGR00027 family)